MSRKLLLIAVVSTSLVAFAQNAQQAQSPNNPSQPASAVPETPQANPGNFNTGGWITTYGGVGAEGGVLLSTPTASFASPLPTAGVSDAGRAGISVSAPVSGGLEGTVNPSTMVYTNMPGYGAVSPAVAAVASPEGGPVNDLGASFYSEKLGVLPAAGPSVAEVASRYKAVQAQQQNIRTYTNADVPHENAGRLSNTVLAANTAPPIPQSSAYQSAPAAPSTSQQSQPANPQPSAQPQPATREPESQSQTTGSATTPQINQPQSTNKESTSSLPATSTFLPLLGLLGLVTGGIGVWYRRRHR